MPNSPDMFHRPDAVRGAFEISHHEVAKGTCVVSPAGEIDLASAPRLKAALLELQRDGCSQFIVDLSSVEHMDSTGLGVLVGLKRQLADRGLLAIAAVPRNVLSLFEITGLDARFEIFSTLDEALIYVRGASVPASGSC